MVRHSTSTHNEDARIVRPVITAREIVSIRRTLDELGVARCPLCRAVLIARQGRAGPYFDCRCKRTTGAA